MPTLYVQDVPEQLYEGLRKQAREHRRSIAAEVIELLEANVPTRKQLEQRRQWLKRIERLRRTPAPGNYPSTEEMVREDRKR